MVSYKNQAKSFKQRSVISVDGLALYLVASYFVY